MIKNKRKGFTIAEMVIVIGVIAILLAILIPTFISLIRKANMNSDLVLAKNLNIAVQEYKEEKGIDDITKFEDAIVAVKMGGYVISTLNAKTKNCLFVWDNKNDQFILVEELNEVVDGKNYKPLYYEIDNVNDIPLPSESDNNNPIKLENGEHKGYWYFAATGFEKIYHITNYFGEKVNYSLIVETFDDLQTALGTQETEPHTIYVDETLLFDINEGIKYNNPSANITIDLGTANKIAGENKLNNLPIDVRSGSLTISNGEIDATGGVYDAAIRVKPGGKLTLDNMTVNGNNLSYGILVHEYDSGTGGEVVVNNTTIADAPMAVLIQTQTNMLFTGDDTYISSTDTMFGVSLGASFTIESGTYEVKEGYLFWINAPKKGPTTNVYIKDGKFDFPDSKGVIFFASQGKSYEQLVITGGTFRGIPFNEVLPSQWAKWIDCVSAGGTGIRAYGYDKNGKKLFECGYQINSNTSYNYNTDDVYKIIIRSTTFVG